MSKKEFAFRASQVSNWTESFRSDRAFVLLTIFWVLPVVFSLLLTFVFFTRLPNEIPLFYSRIWGTGQLAPKQFLFFPTVGVFLLGCFNFAMAINFHNRDRVLSYLLAGAMSLVSILATVTVVNIIRLML